MLLAARLQQDFARRLAAQRDIGAIDTIDVRIATGRAAREGDGGPRNEAKDHEPVRNVLRQMEGGERGFFAGNKVQEGEIVATNLHLKFQYTRVV